MTIRGHVEDGVVILDDTVALPNGTRVIVSPMASRDAKVESALGVFDVLDERYDSGEPDVASRHDEHQT
ncbi:MAG: hypothetical protein MI757_04715 [Pirellulales bacterium]|nr:hypothetical protein [Pirellulales bacterium]